MVLVWRTTLIVLATLITLPSIAAPSSVLWATEVISAGPSTAPLDLNTASEEQTKALPGIGDAYAFHIVKNGPYKRKDDLVQKKAEAATQFSATRTFTQAFTTVLNGSFEEQQGPTPYPQIPTDKEIKINNYSRPLREVNGVMYFEWRVFIDGPSQVLNRIAEVQYELHPTFDDRFQVRSDPNTRFALERGGWGEFRIPITIRYKDGRVEKTTYDLDLTKGWPDERAS
jgi:hypothetical protein